MCVHVRVEATNQHWESFSLAPPPYFSEQGLSLKLELAN